jgi:exopolysaccharide biosynthesis polyprenyl glycosylphosphotransferase
MAVVSGFVLGHLIRFSPPVTRIFPPRPDVPPLLLYFIAGLAATVLWILLFHALGLYRAEGTRRGLRLPVLVRASLLGMLLNGAVAFFYRDASFSRLAAPLIWLITLALLWTLRTLFLHLLVRVGSLPAIRVALVGSTKAGLECARVLPASGIVPHQLVGVFRMSSEEPAPDGMTDLGNPERLEEVAGQLGLDRILIALPAAHTREAEELIGKCRRIDLDFDLLPDLRFPFHGGIQVDELGGVPIVRPRDLPLAGWNGVVKRTIDLAASAILLLVVSPILLVCAIAVKLDSPGPVFYRQERMGRDERVFEILKFRSMRRDAEERTGPTWASREDPRRTRVGEFLRTWSLDELPQLWNVLRGEMSLVGPRPERPHFVRQFHQRVPEYYGRHRIKAGLTGWAQVNGLRGNVPIEERTRYDLYYIENWSLWLDLRILFRTFRAVFSQRGS